jgi:hypothetical protein
MDRSRILILILFSLIISELALSWEIDLSRRRRKSIHKDVSKGRSLDNAEMGFLKDLFRVSKPHQEIVILNTKEGFIPKVVRLKKNIKYTFYIVNVNDSEKNVSFIIDAFSEHHATYFGKMKSFEVTPKKEGVYSFQSPETSIEGQIVVYSDSRAKRATASEE